MGTVNVGLIESSGIIHFGRLMFSGAPNEKDSRGIDGNDDHDVFRTPRNIQS
jgi:hypothetical protein